MARMIERVVLGVIVLLMAVQTYLVWSVYTTVQAQVARVTAVEARIDREVAAVKADAEARVKRVEDELARIRQVPGR
jgi:Flp pilus assembly protein TadB